LAGWGGVDEAGDQEGEADKKDDHDTDGDKSAVMAIHGDSFPVASDTSKKRNRLKSILPRV